MGIFDRLSSAFDEVTLPDRLRRRLDDAERLLVEGDPEGALTLLAGVETERPGLWRSALLSGLAWEARADYPRAVERLNRALDVRDTIEVRAALARVARASGDSRAAIEHNEAALNRRPAAAEELTITTSLAELYQEEGRFDRAVVLLRRAHRVAPRDVGVRTRLLRALILDNDTEAAIALVDAQASPTFDEVVAVAGLRIDQGGEPARIALAQLHALSPDEASHWSIRALEARGHAALHEHAESAARLRQAMADAPAQSRGGLLHQLAMAQRACGNIDDAILSLQEALRLDGDPEVAADLAALCLDKERYADAIAVTKSLVAEQPNSRRARALHGRALIATGSLAEARAALSNLRTSRREPEILHALGELAAADGDLVEAIALLRDAGTENVLSPSLRRARESVLMALAPELPSEALDELVPVRLAPFLDALAAAVAMHPLLADLVPRSAALRQQLDAPLVVAVLGEFSAGKSTLINAFFGEEMLATGVLPTTSHVNVIRYGPRPVARWTHRDGSVDEIPFSEASTLVKSRPDDVAHLEFCYPHPDLRSIHFWDTPGFNAPDEAHEQRAGIALQSADAIVWVLDAGQALTMTEFERIEEITRASERLLVVVNKLDRLGGDEDALNEIREHLAEHLGDNHVGVFPVSALRAINARREGVAVDSSWDSFESALKDRFFARAGRLKALEVAHELRLLVDEVLHRAQSRMREIDLAREGLAAMRVAVQVDDGRRTKRITELRHGLDDGIRRLRVDSASIAAELGSPGRGLFARATLAPEDRDRALTRLVERATQLYEGAALAVAGEMIPVDTTLLEGIENVAAPLGPNATRVLRRRAEAFSDEASTLRRLLNERAVATPVAVLQARVDDRGGAVFDKLASGELIEAERESRVREIVALGGEAWEAQAIDWAAEYSAAAIRFCDHVERDLDMLALEVEHRILRAFDRIRQRLSDAPVPPARLS